MAHTRPACWSGRSWPQLSRSGSGRPVVMRRLSLRWVGGLGSWSAGRPAECGTDVPGPRPSPVRRLVPGQRPAVWPGCAATHRRIRRGPTSETFQTKPPASMGWVARHAEPLPADSVQRTSTATPPTPRDCHRTATSPNDRERPPRREPHRGVTNLAVGVESGGRSYSAPAQGNILVTECCSIGRGGRIRGAGPRSRWARRPVTVASVIIAAAAAGRGRSLPRAASGVD